MSTTQLEFYAAVFAAIVAVVQAASTAANLMAPGHILTKGLLFLARMLPGDVRPYLQKLFPTKNAEAQITKAAEAMVKVDPSDVKPAMQEAATALSVAPPADPIQGGVA